MHIGSYSTADGLQLLGIWAVDTSVGAPVRTGLSVMTPACWPSQSWKRPQVLTDGTLLRGCLTPALQLSSYRALAK